MSFAADRDAAEKNGFVVLSHVLDPEKVARARVRFQELYEADLEARHRQGITEDHFPNGPAGYTIRTKPSHLMLSVLGKNVFFDDLVEEMLANPRVQNLIRSWSGPHFKMGGVNIRFMSGEFDPPPAHELHRDGAGSMNLGIMLTDVVEGDNAATAVIPGSHRYPSCPRWDMLYSAPFRLRKDHGRSGNSWFLKFNIFSRWLKSSLPAATGAFGKTGDVYFLGNGEVWHGRLPNMHGRRTMICLIGLCGIDEEALTDKPSASTEVIRTLGPRTATALAGPFEMNDRSGTILEKLYAETRPASFYSLFYWARVERKFLEWVSEQLDNLARLFHPILFPYRFLQRVLRFGRRTARNIIIRVFHREV